MTIEITRLPNGLTVASDRMETVESVTLGLWVGVGTRHEPAAVNGVAHLLEHMVFKGTTRRSALDIAEEIEAVGGTLNAYTGRESTAYHAKVLSGDLPLAIDMLSDILQNSVFDEDELLREKQVVLQEIGQANDTPDDIIFDLSQELAYPDQPLGWSVLGRPEVVSSLDRKSVMDYMSSRYGADRMVFAAAGKVDHDDLVKRVAAAFDGLSGRGEIVCDQPRYRGGDLREARDLEQVHMILGFDGVGLKAPDYYDAAVFSTLLGGGMSSRLFQEIREKRGLVYSIFSYAACHTDSGLFGIYAGTGKEAAGELLPVICSELKKVVADGVSDKELNRAKTQLKASILMSRERTSARAELLANQLLVHGRHSSVEETVAKIEAVDKAALSAFGAKLLRSAPTLTGLGPVAELTGYDTLTDLLSGSSQAA
ncbi:M16 family metallopeptidase [Rhodovibrionaceae bacterium A322]